MSAQQSHIIQTATLDLQYNGTTDVLQLQREVEDWLYELINSAEQSFDLAPSDEFVLIRNMSIDVTIDGKNWKQQAKEKILKQLREKVKTATDHNILLSVAEKEMAGQIRLEQLFLFYLFNGFLPWNTSVTSVSKLEEVMIQKGFAVQNEFIEKISSLLQKSVWARTRFIQQFSAKFVQIVLQKMIARVSIDEKLRFDLEKVVELIVQPDVHSQKNELLILLTEAVIFIQKKEQLLFESISKLVLVPALSNKTFVARFDKANFKSRVFSKVQQQLRKQITESLVKVTRQNQVVIPSSSKTDLINEKGPVIRDGIYIPNAGLVIAVPFLTALFSRLELAKDNILLDIDKAVCVTHFLSTGDSNIQEHDLVLAKILCGLHPAFPVNTTEFTITTEQIEEVNGVLNSIIEYWSVLKDTSVQGLQESFLLREGKVVYVNNRWLLIVEQKPYDMLLQQLPWNISMLQLPWMKDILITEWVY